LPLATNGFPFVVRRAPWCWWNRMVTLDTLREGERARVVDVVGDDAISVRLMEMGLVEGIEVELVGFAPLGDPIEFRIRGYRLSLRSTEARRVQVERQQEG
jgi:ferrous iron transport protein A